MTAEQLKDKHNQNKNTVRASLNICEQFLSRYKDKLACKTDEQIFNIFENWFYELCFG